MGLYCDGEAAAFHRLYALTASRILAYLVGLVRDRPLAEDLLQQTYLRLHGARASYVRGANPVPWLYTIAHNLALDELRRRKRARVQLSASESLPGEPRATLTGDAEDALPPAAESPDGFSLALLDQLPHGQKEALLLTKVHGHSVAQAAAIAGTTPGALRVRAHRGYERLRALLARKASDTAPGPVPAARHEEEPR